MTRPEPWATEEGAVVRGDPTRRELALVFTGGEFGEGTPHILDVLATHGIHASFFLTGDYLAVPEHRDWVRRMIQAGHVVGPHSHGHLLYCAWEDRQRTLVTREAFEQDLTRNIEELRALGALPSGEPIYFIPPFEWYNREQVDWARDLGITLFNFTRGTRSNRDWIPEGQRGFVSSREILADILAHEASATHGLNGHLLLLHLGSERRDKMHALLGPLLEALVQRGYGFRRVDELLSNWRALSPPLPAVAD